MYKITGEVIKHLDGFKSIESELKEALVESKQLHSKVQLMAWQGEARDHFIMLQDLVIQFHEALATFAETYAKQLEKDVERFNEIETGTHYTIKDIASRLI